MNLSDKMHGSMIRCRLEGKVPVSILKQMTDVELAEEYRYNQQEKIRWANRGKTNA